MSKCDDQQRRCAPNGCGCVQYDPLTGEVFIDGNPVKLYTQASTIVTAETLEGSLLNPAIKVPASSIQNLCDNVKACLVGGLDANAIKPGAQGDVLQTLAGKTVWAPLGDDAIQKAFADSVVPQPPIDNTELAKIYGEDAAKNLVSVPPVGAYEAAVSGMPQSSTAAPLKQITGIDAGGMAVRSRVIQNGFETKNEVPNLATTPVALSASLDLVSVNAPANGLYAVSLSAPIFRATAAPLPVRDANLLQNFSTVFLVNAPSGLLYHSGSDGEVQIGKEHAWPIGADLGQAVRFGQVAIAWLKAGDAVSLSIYNASVNGAAINVSSPYPVGIKLTALGAVQIATP